MLKKTKLAELIFWYDRDDKYVGQRIALGKYEEFETKIFLEQLKPEMIVVDVGANIGYYTLLAAKKVKKVYAIEPDKRCFEILKKNIEENGFKNVVLINKAVGDKNELRYLIKDKRNMGNGRIKSLSTKAVSPFDERERTQMTTLDRIIKEKVDLLKIDVQGYEPQVVEGGEKIIERDSPTIFVEYNKNQYQDDSMINFLRKIYKAIWQIDYWYYVYWKTGKEIEVDKKIGYTNLWMKKNAGVVDYVRGFKDIQWKKVVRVILGR